MVTMRDIEDLRAIIMGLQNIVSDLVLANLRTNKMIVELTERVKKLEQSVETSKD